MFVPFKIKKSTIDVVCSDYEYDTSYIIQKLKTNINLETIKQHFINGTMLQEDWFPTSADTARALTERIKHSRAILYVLTETGITSVWTPWELGYAQALGKKICVLPMENNIMAPEYLDIYDRAVVDEDKVYVKMNDKQVPIEEWVS